ncbi:hypothetical protein AB0B28_08820 [Glycomyces sp. NPDC046736]|uniref:hypothetical protein n=1 Tax=Glycomyces sp. NPDC046736 TaxID=3155615 RepID=UPI0033CF396E
MTRWIPAADWWVELALVPAALGTIFWSLWYQAYLSPPGGQYGVGAGILAGLWFIVFCLVDIQRFRHRAAILLIVPLALPVGLAWSAVDDLAMYQRGVVEDCPVSDEYTYQVSNKFGTHWETRYILDCEQGEAEVTFAAAAPEESYDTDGESDYDLDSDYDNDYDWDSGYDAEYTWDDGPTSYEVEYDPLGILKARTGDYMSEGDKNPAGALYFAGFLALAAIGVRLYAVHAREHG